MSSSLFVHLLFFLCVPVLSGFLYALPCSTLSEFFCSILFFLFILNPFLMSSSHFVFCSSFVSLFLLCVPVCSTQFFLVWVLFPLFIPSGYPLLFIVSSSHFVRLLFFFRVSVPSLCFCVPPCSSLFEFFEHLSCPFLVILFIHNVIVPLCSSFVFLSCPCAILVFLCSTLFFLVWILFPLFLSISDYRFYSQCYRPTLFVFCFSFASLFLLCVPVCAIFCTRDMCCR